MSDSGNSSITRPISHSLPKPGRAGAPFLSNFDPTAFTLGCFGLVPQWAEPKLARNTYNARAETVGEKPSYRNAWKQRQLCVIPRAGDLSRTTVGRPCAGASSVRTNSPSASPASGSAA
ncbi:MAG: SOS response-associated peptidase family protein [Uliginosibacterium sp.]|nr:SOS response-associated peptidase family protein [Uliginosibacterium sp.]